MPKQKVKLKEEHKSYFSIGIGVGLIIVSLLIIGRVGGFVNLYFVLGIIFGDYTILLLIFTIYYAVYALLMGKKFDFHHISFLGFVLIYFGLSMLDHLGLYKPLSMSKTTVLTETVKLYTRYFKYYQHGFSLGGGIISAIFVQVFIFLGGQVGVIIISIGLIFVGICYILDFDLLSFIKGGRLRTIPKEINRVLSSYFKNMHYEKKSPVKANLSKLKDSDEIVSFTLQNEINKERAEELKKYIQDKHIYCAVIGFETSYTSSRFILKMAHKSECALSEISGFFEKCCFFIRDEQTVYVEVANQFKKLLTLKKLLALNEKKNEICLFSSVDNRLINFNVDMGRCLFVIGDETSGVKTFIRAFLCQLLFKGVKKIYFYDLVHEFEAVNNHFVNYIDGERKMDMAFDEAFEVYERRSEAMKFLNADDVIDANRKIREMGTEYEQMEPIIHIIFYNPLFFDSNSLKKLSYLITLGVNVGMSIILVARNKELFSKVEMNNSDVLAFRINDISTSVKLFGSDIACRLQKKGDVIYQSKNGIFHGQTPYISLDDFISVMK